MKQSWNLWFDPCRNSEKPPEFRSPVIFTYEIHFMWSKMCLNQLSRSNYRNWEIDVSNKLSCTNLANFKLCLKQCKTSIFRALLYPSLMVDNRILNLIILTGYQQLHQHIKKPNKLLQLVEIWSKEPTRWIWWSTQYSSSFHNVASNYSSTKNEDYYLRHHGYFNGQDTRRVKKKLDLPSCNGQLHIENFLHWVAMVE